MDTPADEDDGGRYGPELVEFDLRGLLRRIRRAADLSQRELAARLGVSKASIAHAEVGRRDLPSGVLVRAARLAGFRVALLDAGGREVTAMDPAAVRDAGGRRYPAHLDTRHGDDGWWNADEDHPSTPPWYTFDRARWSRDRYRAAWGVPDDHQLPDPGDDPLDREELRAAVAKERRSRAMWRRRERGSVPGREGGLDFSCECPAGCDPAREVLAEVHVPGCPCQCDVS